MSDRLSVSEDVTAEVLKARMALASVRASKLGEVRRYESRVLKAEGLTATADLDLDQIRFDIGCQLDRIRGLQFDGAWIDEIRCAAIDKGTNQTNKFLDPKSSESGLPKYSNGGRDDLIQAQHLQAIHEFWSEPANYPASDVYSSRMVDISRMFV